jgi:hypothetical protein
MRMVEDGRGSVQVYGVGIEMMAIDRSAERIYNPAHEKSD